MWRLAAWAFLARGGGWDFDVDFFATITAFMWIYVVFFKKKRHPEMPLSLGVSLGRGVLFAEVFAAVFARGEGFAAFFAAPAFLVVKFFAVAFARVATEFF